MYVVYFLAQKEKLENATKRLREIKACKVLKNGSDKNIA